MMKPLFTIEELKEAIQNMDMSERGSDEEYGWVVFREYMDSFYRFQKDFQKFQDSFVKSGFVRIPTDEELFGRPYRSG